MVIKKMTSHYGRFTLKKSFNIQFLEKPNHLYFIFKSNHQGSNPGLPLPNQNNAEQDSRIIFWQKTIKSEKYSPRLGNFCKCSSSKKCLKINSSALIPTPTSTTTPIALSLRKWLQASLNNKIKYTWFNDSFNTFKVKCKQLLLQ